MDEVGLQAAVEMLKRELDASKSVSTHLGFLKRIASGETVSPTLRQELLDHIGEEEVEHQEHLARLLPALESLTRRFEGPAGSREASSGSAPARSGGLTVGNLTTSRPWFTR